MTEEKNSRMLEPRVARLEEGQERLKQDVEVLRKEQKEGFSDVTHAINNFQKTRAEDNKTPWSVLIAAGSFILLLGGMFSELQRRPIEFAINEIAKKETETHDLVSENYKTLESKIETVAKSILDQEHFLEAKIETVSQALHDHENTDGHQTLVSRVDRLESVVQDASNDIDKINEEISYMDVMQEKMSNVEAGIVNLDVVLQREMRLLDEAMNVKIENLDTVLQREIRLLNDTQDVEVGNLLKVLQKLQNDVEEIKLEQAKRTKLVYEDGK